MNKICKFVIVLLVAVVLGLVFFAYTATKKAAGSQTDRVSGASTGVGGGYPTPRPTKFPTNSPIILEAWDVYFTMRFAGAQFTAQYETEMFKWNVVDVVADILQLSWLQVQILDIRSGSVIIDIHISNYTGEFDGDQFVQEFQRVGVTRDVLSSLLQSTSFISLNETEVNSFAPTTPTPTVNLADGKEPIVVITYEMPYYGGNDTSKIKEAIDEVEVLVNSKVDQASGNPYDFDANAYYTASENFTVPMIYYNQQVLEDVFTQVRCARSCSVYCCVEIREMKTNPSKSLATSTIVFDIGIEEYGISPVSDYNGFVNAVFAALGLENNLPTASFENETSTTALMTVQVFPNNTSNLTVDSVSFQGVSYWVQHNASSLFNGTNHTVDQCSEQSCSSHGSCNTITGMCECDDMYGGIQCGIQIPTQSPSISPSTSPSQMPTRIPSVGPTHSPTIALTTMPTVSPTSIPTGTPTTLHPSESPTDAPTTNPSASPSTTPTYSPSAGPTVNPTYSPSENPTNAPTENPTNAPSASPSETPTNTPSISPSETPTNTPSVSPSETPTIAPSVSPSENPTNAPSVSPTATPTSSPSVSPSENPTSSPSASPSENPTNSPSASPSENPTSAPSVSPSENPTNAPSASPSETPTKAPSVSPSGSPTTSPSASPTASPTTSPSASPTVSPTSSPSESPTSSPSVSPTMFPSVSPTRSPTSSPTVSPTYAPTGSPTFPAALCECEQLYLWVHCYKNLTVRQYLNDQLVLQARPYNFESEDQWKSIYKQTFFVEQGSRVELECTSHNTTAAMVSQIYLCGRRYITTPGTDYTDLGRPYQLYAETSNATTNDTLQYTPIGQGHWAEHVQPDPFEINSDAYWVESNSTSKLTISFDLMCTASGHGGQTEPPTPLYLPETNCSEAVVTANCDNNLTFRQYQLVGNDYELVQEKYKDDVGSTQQWKTSFTTTINITEGTVIDLQCQDLGDPGGVIAQVEACGQLYHTKQSTSTSLTGYAAPFTFYINMGKSDSLVNPLVYTALGGGLWANHVNPLTTSITGDAFWVWDSQEHNRITLSFEISWPPGYPIASKRRRLQVDEGKINKMTSSSPTLASSTYCGKRPNQDDDNYAMQLLDHYRCKCFYVKQSILMRQIFQHGTDGFDLCRYCRLKWEDFVFPGYGGRRSSSLTTWSLTNYDGPHHADLFRQLCSCCRIFSNI